MGADDVVLAVGLVPNWADIDPEFFGCDEGVELGMRAVGETVADSEGVFGANFHSGNRKRFSPQDAEVAKGRGGGEYEFAAVEDNPLFPFPDRLSSVFSALGEKANS